MVQIAAEVLGEIERVMRQRGVVRAGLFGSMARGEAGPESDFDFLVEFEKGRSLLDLAGLRLDLEDTLGRPVDVATPNSLHPKLKDRILSELVPLL
jgi:predicted nucleotidyltransferase